MDEKIKRKFLINLDEEDMDTQKKYFEWINKIIDEILLLKYTKGKKDIYLASALQLNELILYYFNQITIENKVILFNELIEKLSFFIKESNLTDEKYMKVIEELFMTYVKNNRTLPPTETAHIYTKLLNEKQDIYVAINRKKIINSLKYKFPLTDKKREHLLLQAKLKRAKTLIRLRKLELLGMDLKELEKLLWNLHENINRSKPFNKKPLTDSIFNKLDALFLNDSLTYNQVRIVCKDMEKSTIKKLTAKYNRILLPFLLNIEKEEVLIKTDSIEFNPKDIKIFSKKQYEKNLDFLLSSMSEEEKEYLLSNAEELSVYMPLLPLVKLPYLKSYFNIETFKSLLLNFKKIKSILSENGKILNNNLSSILNNFKECLRLSEILHYADATTYAILGESRVEKIILNNKNTSSNTYDFVNTYIKMLKSNKTYLPPISFDFQIKDKVYQIESGNNYVLDRLLIGKEIMGSCIGPKGEGEYTFYKCLTEEDADVLLIKKKDTLEFVARMIMIRIGNAIVMAPIYEHEVLAEEFYTKEFLNTLCKKLLEKAAQKQDNIDYIFIAQEDKLDQEGFDIDIDYNIGKFLPHCDIYSSLNRIYAIEQNININYYADFKEIYEKARRKIEVKQDNYEEDINRIEELYYLMTNKRKEKSFNYKSVYIGQDFYIGIGKNNIYSTVLPTKDKRQRIEMEACLDEIILKSTINNMVLEQTQPQKIKIK